MKLGSYLLHNTLLDKAATGKLHSGSWQALCLKKTKPALDRDTSNTQDVGRMEPTPRMVKDLTIILLLDVFSP